MERLTKNQGFSLAELIVVVLVLAILAIVTYFKWSNSSINLNGQAALLANDIRYTQNLSISKNQRFSLVKISSTSYQIQDALGNPVPNSNSNTNPTILASGITFGTFQTITNRITFNTKGIPYNDNPVAILTTTAIMPLTSNGETVNVTIYPETGRITP